MSDEPEIVSGKEKRLRNLVPIQKGQVLNPKGRGIGVRNRLGEAFLEALNDDFNKHGVAAIIEVRETRPHEYLRVIAGILPKELKVSASSDLSDDELDRRIHQLAAALSLELRGEEGTSRLISGEEAASGPH